MHARKARDFDFDFDFDFESRNFLYTLFLGSEKQNSRIPKNRIQRSYAGLKAFCVVASAIGFADEGMPTHQRDSCMECRAAGAATQRHGLGWTIRDKSGFAN